ncbi:MAG: hypothetical protein OXE81_10850 [Gammaproteobacteria bacterium]|nr:hypothetical protein [Gammaproteobacteria bacterium]MCY4278314.1 hypothetical protein [Gammaproteobacteria bacterium]
MHDFDIVVSSIAARTPILTCGILASRLMHLPTETLRTGDLSLLEKAEHTR